MAKVPAFTELGSTAKDLLYGTKEGKFNFDKVLNVSSKTSDGVDFTVGAVVKDDKLDLALKGTYTAPKYTVVANITQGNQAAVAVTAKELAPGLTLGLSGILPKPDTAKLALDYTMPHLTVKSTASLTASPKVDVSAVTGYQGLASGGSVSYDTATSAITQWTVGLGYTAGDYQVAALLNDRQALTGMFAHKVNATTTLGAEVTHDLNMQKTAMAAGLSRRLEDGALVKAKLDHTGIVSAVYEQSIRPYSKLAISAQLNALALDQAPRFGFGYDLKY